MNLTRFPLLAIALLLLSQQAKAQFELKTSSFNSTWVAQTPTGAAATPSGPPVAFDPPATAGQFAAVADMSAVAVPVGGVFPATSDRSFVLMRASIGVVFSPGATRYTMGQEILPPLVKADGTTPADPSYWRTKPVLPGESIPGLGVPIATGSVNVVSASTSSTAVTLTGTLPAQLIEGAQMLGQPISRIAGTTVTLAGSANANISASTVVAVTPGTSYYYSPHSNKVYASQPGSVAITWVSRQQNLSGNYELRAEEFAVSSTTLLKVRTIFWTEGIFDGPKVQISDSRITSVNPAYYYRVPKAVAEEVLVPGYTPATPNLTTLSFDRFNGIGQLHAYNAEGRVLVEYLGGIKTANIYESLGTELIELVRAPIVNYATVSLGKEIIPSNGNVDLTPAPVLSTAQNGATYYGTQVRPNGTSAYFAERETSPPNEPDNGEPFSSDAYNKAVFYWMEESDFYGIKWPKFQDRYWLRWSPSLADYAHYTVDPTGSTPATGIAFTGGSLPQIVYQDDPAQQEAQIDLTTQRLFVKFSALPSPSDQRNRSLLKFSNNSSVWYVNVYTQAENRTASRVVDAAGTANITLTGGTTSGLEVGMIVTGNGISSGIQIVSITDSTHLVLSGNVTTDGTYKFSVQEDEDAPIDTIATVGSRLVEPLGYEKAGYISGGTNYYPAGYLNPFTVGVESANLGAIIPVNARPTDNVLSVRWFKKVTAPSADFQDLYVPGKTGRYTVSYPTTTTPQIVIAQGVGTDDLPPAEAAGKPYVQNDVALPGFNPNEEHAIMDVGRAYALREDLNITSGPDYTSQPFLLLAYTAADHRPAIHAYKVLREIDLNGNGIKDDGDIMFDYTSVAGTELKGPYPLPLMDKPMVGTGLARKSKDLEIISPDPLTNTTVSGDDAYKKFTFQDRKGITWIHRGPHNGGSPTLTMKLYYKSRPGFWVPGMNELPEGTILPFLRASSRKGINLDITKIEAKADGSPGDADEPLPIIYRPTWPSNPAELRVGETLTLEKFSLPAVRGQASAEVLYQQSIANAATTTALTKNSVTLHDPTREKTTVLGAAGVALTALPKAIKTSTSRGKVYFQGLPPHLQQRFYFDPLRETGTLVFSGTFHDELAGEDYLDLNVLTVAEEQALKDLVPVGNEDKANWDAAIDKLETTLETFKPDPAQFGSYIVDHTKDKVVGENELAVISSTETAVDSYAITATGQGTGFVTMVFNSGKAFTPEGNPVEVKVFKIADRLYVGDLKTILSSNPLDEQVTLRHSGDFAGKPEDYEFEWRWATGEASAPKTYSTVMTKRLGDAATSTQNWLLVSDPGAQRPTDVQYAAAGAAVPFTPARTVNVHPVKYELDAQGQPTTTVINSGVFTKTPTFRNGTTITVDSTALLKAGMSVTGASLSGTASVLRVTDGTHFVLSQSPSSLAPLTIDGSSYSDADMAAGYPSMVLKSASTVDFSSGVPGEIVLSAALGSNDGLVLYVNGGVALAYNAPAAFFTLTNASSGLTEIGKTDRTLKQFSIAPSYFTKGANIIEIAIYTTADANAQSSLSFVLEAAQETDIVTSPSTAWQSASDPLSRNTNTAIIGGSTLNPFGGPQFVLNDRWFTVRYRPKASANNVLGTPWSRWMPPQFVEGWVKRVLAAINPFEQRVKDMFNNAINTDVSVLTQAGTRWEGDVALTMDNINDVGLIAIYETVLNRAKNMSINANTNDPDTNNALILAAGYLNDLYTLLGNEAYADAANPTISIDDQATVTEVNTSRFSFEGQVASSLDEELALLRGRNNLVSPGVQSAPAYNRLYWNYTHGINSGEVLYAVNYNIKEKVGSTTANGVIDESDAQRMFPQGHGDAYGHYLTALTGYYNLLTNANFTWTPRAEAVTVLGQAITVDFMDERKFAAAASNVARTAQQVVSLAYRQSYNDDPAQGWEHYHNDTPEQGLDEWVSRGTQGAFYNWVVANALVPAEDTYHSSVQKIDRTTVPEIQELVTEASSLQTTIDNANAHLNPLGLSPGAIAFDLSPSEMLSGKSHYEQIADRALTSLVNASGAFNQAATMTRSLRDQQNQVDDYSTTIAQQETAYVNQLIDIYGRPYSGDIGAGNLYDQSYTGPDLTHWFIVDRPNDLVDTKTKLTVTIQELTGIDSYTDKPLVDLVAAPNQMTFTDRAVTVQPSQWVQYNDVWKTGGLGSRPETGSLQEALQDAQQSWLALSNISGSYKDTATNLARAIEIFTATVQNHVDQLAAIDSSNARVRELTRVVLTLNSVADGLEYLASFEDATGNTLAEFFPRVNGVDNDTTSSARGAIKFIGDNLANIANGLALASRISAGATEIKILTTEQGLEKTLQNLGFANEELQSAYELDMLIREHVGHHEELMQFALAHQRALQNVNNVLAKGNRLLAEREVFRQRAAAIIQGYRTKDLSFRIFRNEALEQYRSLFDLASRYTYLAAKSYDYETGLLGTTQGQTVFAKIVAARSLGDLTGGVPQSTVSTLGDAGLAGTMARLHADFSVAEGRLGINNPDQYGTVFSLRSELYRLLDDPNLTNDDEAWRQTLEHHVVSNVLADADVASYCMNIKKPDGTPVPGVIIPFSTTIQHGKNFFGLDLAAGDHAYSPSSFATKIYNVGVVLKGYIGMDAYATGGSGGAAASGDPNALSATPYVYLIPCGNDYMLAPPLGDTNTLRSWNVKDQALPLPYNLGANDFNSTQFFNANGTLSEQPWILRKHQAFRPVNDASMFYSSVPAEFTNSRLIGRSVWNGQWKIVIPAYTMLNNEQDALNRFASSVKDIQLFLRTYSNSGN